MANRQLAVIVLGIFLVGILSCGSPKTPSTRIVYTFAGTASGSLGNVSFTNAPFTLTVTSDTAAVTPATQSCSVATGVCQLFSAPATNVTFLLTQQKLSATFTTAAGMFVNQTFPAVGLRRMNNQALDMLDIQDQAFATYNLKTAIGPVGSLSVVLGQFNCNFGCVQTTLGVLTVNSVANTTFTASLKQ